MMKRKLFIILSIVLFFRTITTEAQDLSYVKAQLNTMFSGLDKTKVPTGYLWDTAANIVEVEDYSGAVLTDSNYVDLPRLHDLIESINSSSVWADTLDADAAINRIKQLSSMNSTQIGFLFKKYNRIKSGALENNLISFSNGVVSDMYDNGIWKNPYIEGTVIGFAIGNNGSVYKSVTYTICDVDSLSTYNYSSIQFDPGDGNGYRTVSINNPLQVNYSSTGYKEAKLKIIQNGNTYLSHGIVLVKEMDAHLNLTHPLLVDTVSFAAVYNGVTYRAMVSYLNTASFNKPLIVSEGFDPWRFYKRNANNMSYTHSYSGATNIKSLIESLQESDNYSLLSYDLFYVDWYDYGADIRANAKLLELVINWVNDNKTSGNANTVLGQSMGGLIARYCLRDMEIRSIPHDTQLFISHDVPYSGANISPGLLFTYWDFRAIITPLSPLLVLFDGINEIVPDIMRMGNYMSIKQMLPYYVNSSGIYDNSAYNALQNELHLMGFPKGDPDKTLENIAIINGGPTAGGGSLYLSSTELLTVNLDVTTGPLTELLLLISQFVENNPVWIPGRSTLSFQHHVYPFFTNSSPVRYTKLTYTKKFLWWFSIPFTIIDKTDYSPANGPCLDNVRASYYSTTSLPSVWHDYHTSEGSFGELFGAVDAVVEMVPRLSFIPVASAFAKSNYSEDYYNHPPMPKVDIPFDAYIIRDTCSYHTSMFNIHSWLENISNTQIMVPPVIFDGDTLKVSGATKPFTWLSSSNAVATINSSGIVNIGTGGLVEITALADSSGQRISKRSKAIVGYPQVSLSIESLGSGDFSVKASMSSFEHDGLVKEAVAEGILEYKWGVKKGDETIINWRTTQSDTIHVNTYGLSAPLSVYMKWVVASNEEEYTREIQVPTTSTIVCSIDHIVARLNTLSYVDNPLGYYPNVTSNYGHKCLTFNMREIDGPPLLTSLSINNELFPISMIFLDKQGGLGNWKTVYVFDVLYNNTFQNIIMQDPRIPGLFNLTLTLNDSDGPVYQVDLPVVPFFIL